MARSVTVLSSLVERIHEVDLASCSSGDLKALSAATVEGLGVLEGFLVQIATAARRLEDAGSGSPVVDVIRSGGVLSKHRSEQVARRVEVGDLLPTLGADLSQGVSRPENVDIVARRSARLSDEERRRLSSQDQEVSERARSLPPEVFHRYFTDVLRRVEDRRDEPSIAERQRAASRFAMGRRFDGMWWLKGELDGERGAELQAVLRAKVAEHVGDDPVTDNAGTDRAMAAALHELATTTRTSTASTTTASVDGGRARLPIGYIVDAQTLAAGPHDHSVAQTWAGETIDPASAARLACDVDCYAVVVDEVDQPGPVGRTRRSATREQRLQLRALYDGCPLDSSALDRCEIHHVNLPWENGGETELDNLLPISTTWHHRIHDRGWTLEMAPDRSLKLWRPDGTLERSIPPPTPLTRRE